MLPNKEVELFKQSFINNESSGVNLIAIKNCLFELKDEHAEAILSEYIDKKISLLIKRK
jgi:hypothetical protein